MMNISKSLIVAVVVAVGVAVAGVERPPAGNVWAAEAITLRLPAPTRVKVREKYELKFDVATSAQYPFFEYDENPPAGVAPKIGVSVTGIFTSPSGKTLRHPAFYTTEVVRHNENTRNMWFEETNQSYWVLRFSPQEVGTYSVSIDVRDAQGARTQSVGAFQAITPTKQGFIRVSKADPRYFEYSNGDIFWPIGPAWNRGNDYSRYKNTGQNTERPWVAGIGAYSTNWARWIRTDKPHGNEGNETALTFKEHYPGHELSYPLSSGAAFRFWLPIWGNEMFAQHIEANTKYRVKLIYKTVNLAGPRIAGKEWGLTLRNHGWIGTDISTEEQESELRANPRWFRHISANQDWTTMTVDYTTGSNMDQAQHLSLYLDNVSSGEAYIDELSIRKVLPDGSVGGELIRNPRADVHTYVDPRGAAYFDWQLEEGEKYGIAFKYVVHDKNDWVQNHLNESGQWLEEWYNPGWGYYQAENTKARWLLRQWYRYLVARYGYSTSVHSWELNNEGPPNDQYPPGDDTSYHWRTAQEFAHYMHQIDAHPHLATTSFWCCWRPEFWGNRDGLFPDIDYADLHYYMDHPEPLPADAFDVAGTLHNLGELILRDQVGKPVWIGETGISYKDQSGNSISPPELEQPNPGIWYHNYLWVGLSPGAVFAPGNFFSVNIDGVIDKEGISRIFYNFVKALDVHKGGYTDAAASVSNPKIRAWGQKNVTNGKAHLWIQNAGHEWRNPNPPVQSGTVTIILTPNRTYDVSWYNTYTEVTTAQQLTSDGAGKLTLTISKLKDDVAVKLAPREDAAATSGVKLFQPFIQPLTSNVGWSQDGANPQRTGYTAEEPVEPWTYAWSFNAADAKGRVSCRGGNPETGHCYDAPIEGRTVTGDGKLYVPAGRSGLYAVTLARGNTAWRLSGTFNACPAYADGYLYVGRSDGKVLKVRTSNGFIASQYDVGSGVNKAVLVSGTSVYALGDNGTLHKIDTGSMSRVWVYSAESPTAISMAYSPSRRVVVFATEDLYVHGVNDGDGSRKWRVKPTIHDPAPDYKFRWGWPVIAEKHGIVFLRMRLDRQAVYGAKHPNTNAELRHWYDCYSYSGACDNPWENLFALDLNTGNKAFYPLVGYQSIEFWDDSAQSFFTDQGGLPVVKVLPDGKEVVYMQFRNGSSYAQTDDARADSLMGEMVLDDSTVPGLKTGDFRIVRMSDANTGNGNNASNIYISDESSPITLAGDTIFYAHFHASESARITDRRPSRAGTWANPIMTVNHPPVVREVGNDSCGPMNVFTHYCSSAGLAHPGEPYGKPFAARVWPGPGWWQYYNAIEPPGSPVDSTYSAGVRPRYTYVSNGYIVVSGNGGSLTVFKHSGVRVQSSAEERLVTLSREESMR